MIGDKKTDEPRAPYSDIALLNTPQYDMGASARIRVRVDKENELEKYELEIRSCEDSIMLHGRLRDDEERTNALYKLEELIRMSSNLRRLLKREFDERGLGYGQEEDFLDRILKTYKSHG